MVRGLDKFKEFFVGHDANYIIIGGAACDILDEIENRKPRATKDIDMILIVEALTSEFGKQFWEFVKTGDYETRQRGDGKHEYYRFMKPKNEDFPFQIELFARKSDVLELPEDARYTPIPLDENLSSLSAILMNDDYYYYTLERSMVADGIRFANVESMIVLKAKAFVDLSQRKVKGERFNSDDIHKHRRDVFRLVTLLATNPPALPTNIQDDMNIFGQMVSESLPDSAFFKVFGLDVVPEVIFERLCEAFQIKR
jgi:hypothetical protein